MKKATATSHGKMRFVASERPEEDEAMGREGGFIK
jgi:hypothetical protein